MATSEIDRIVQVAWEARRRSYSPYSGFAVGAAVLSAKGKVYSGTNIENASYGLTVCAERVAIHSAAASGEREIAILAVVAEAEGFATPCGACRQVLHEFRLGANGDEQQETLVVIENGKGERLVLTLEELLPHPFALDKPF